MRFTDLDNMYESNRANKVKTKDQPCPFHKVVQVAGVQRTRDRRRHMDRVLLGWNRTFKADWMPCIIRIPCIWVALVRLLFLTTKKWRILHNIWICKTRHNERRR